MKVRQKREPRPYGGKPVEALDASCPCRACWQPHDYGSYVTLYLPNGRQDRAYRYNLRCATRERAGCPWPLSEAKHEYPPRARTCAGCGQARARAERTDRLAKEESS